jgi:hypothetical protein
VSKGGSSKGGCTGGCGAPAPAPVAAPVVPELPELEPTAAIAAIDIPDVEYESSVEKPKSKRKRPRVGDDSVEEETDEEKLDDTVEGDDEDEEQNEKEELTEGYKEMTDRILAKYRGEEREDVKEEEDDLDLVDDLEDVEGGEPEDEVLDLDDENDGEISWADIEARLDSIDDKLQTLVGDDDEDLDDLDDLNDEDLDDEEVEEVEEEVEDAYYDDKDERVDKDIRHKHKYRGDKYKMNDDDYDENYERKMSRKNSGYQREMNNSLKESNMVDLTEKFFL